MSRPVRCRRCGILFLPDCFAAMVRFRRLCPQCRGPLPPTGGVPVSDAVPVRPWATEAA